MVTKEECINETLFHYGTCSRVVGPRGGVKEDVVQVRASGKCQTWIRDKNKFRLPIKWGLYKSSEITHENADLFHIEENCPLLK